MAALGTEDFLPVAGALAAAYAAYRCATQADGGGGGHGSSSQPRVPSGAKMLSQIGINVQLVEDRLAVYERLKHQPRIPELDYQPTAKYVESTKVRLSTPTSTPNRSKLTPAFTTRRTCCTRSSRRAASSSSLAHTLATKARARPWTPSRGIRRCDFAHFSATFSPVAHLLLKSALLLAFLVKQVKVVARVNSGENAGHTVFGENGTHR